ncbi:unnamed protein product [Pleuronectes platessa]|uniref:Uncharacterized protein n=1 Tax=Pleuronectes platessa TaxID=8262 RepID=A0A9N7VDV5_PLEPL|nr:unnamed protein product [Pleuronectes platessa]
MGSVRLRPGRLLCLMQCRLAAGLSSQGTQGKQRTAALNISAMYLLRPGVVHQALAPGAHGFNDAFKCTVEPWQCDKRQNVPVARLIVVQEWKRLLALSRSLPSEIVIALSSTGATILSSRTGEFSSGQIESLAPNPRQLHSHQCQSETATCSNTTATGFLPPLARVCQFEQHSNTVEKMFSRAAELHVTTHASAGSVWCTAESGGGGTRRRARTRAPVSEYEIAGCQADADAVMRYYLL